MEQGMNEQMKIKGDRLSITSLSSEKHHFLEKALVL